MPYEKGTIENNMTSPIIKTNLKYTVMDTNKEIKFLTQCDCGCAVLSFYYDEEYKNYSITHYIFSGYTTPNWKFRLKALWDILTKSKTALFEVLIDQSQAKLLAEYIDQHIPDVVQSETKENTLSPIGYK